MTKRTLALACGILVTAGFARAQDSQSLEARVKALEDRLAADKDFDLHWKDGIRFDTLDKKVKFKLGGRIQNDWAWFHVDDDIPGRTNRGGAIGNSNDGTEFRRVRLNLQGTINDHFELRTQYDFVGSGKGVFKDVYVGLRDLPYVGGVRVGNFKEPFSLQELTSSNDVLFMERSLPTIFAPSRNVGVMVHNSKPSDLAPVLEEFDDRVTWAAGVFRDTDNFGKDVEDGKYDVTTRVTALPLLNENEDEGGLYTLLHLGAAYSYRNPNEGSVTFAQRPEAHLAKDFLDTGAIPTDEEHRIGAEASLVLGPFNLQGEYFFERLNAQGGLDDLNLQGFYVHASYYLTGEHREYKKSSGYFGRIHPLHPLFGGGCGAWEAVARYSYLDLDSKQVEGGVLHDITAGLNWYPSYNYKVAFNYVYSRLESSEEAHIAEIRFQVAF